MPSKQKKCKFLGCSTKITLHQEIIGFCKNCNKHYCMDHRMPETHNCTQVFKDNINEKRNMIDKLECKTLKINNKI